MGEKSRPMTSHIESLLSRFESLGQKGTPPRLEAVLKLCPEKDRVVLLIELIHIDLERRLKAGEQARLEDYLTRFPGLID
jgi:hypothetical protein